MTELKTVYIRPYPDNMFGHPATFRAIWLLWLLHLALKWLCQDAEWGLFLITTSLILLYSLPFFITKEVGIKEKSVSAPDEKKSDKKTKSKKSAWTFGFPIETEETKNTDKYDYTVYKEEELDQYYEQLLGDSSLIPHQQLDDAQHTRRHDLVKFVAHLVWNEYQAKQAHSHPVQTSALVNMEVLNTVLLSLHPPMVLANMDLSAYTRDGLAELHQFEKLVLEPGACDPTDLQDWLHNLPTNYPGQLAIMGWFLTLTSKMTGYRIPEAGLAPGGLYQLDSQQVEHCLASMETVADAMAEKSHWKWPQYAILNMMHHDLKMMIAHFREL